MKFNTLIEQYLAGPSLLRHAVAGMKKVDRLLASYAEKCSAYQSVKGCIECRWKAEIEEG